MEHKKIKFAKLIARALVGSGTGVISNSIIANNVQPDSLKTKVAVAAASVVIASMAEEATKAHTETRIDEFVNAWNSISETRNNKSQTA